MVHFTTNGSRNKRPGASEANQLPLKNLTKTLISLFLFSGPQVVAERPRDGVPFCHVSLIFKEMTAQGLRSQFQSSFPSYKSSDSVN